jgi:hypothetical protein
MTPGVGLFYAGMVRRKNAIAMITLSIICLIVVGIQRVVYAYSLAFGNDVAGFIGDLSYFMLKSAHLWNVEWFATRFPDPVFARNEATRPTFPEWLEHPRGVFALPAYARAVDTCMARIRQAASAGESIPLLTMRMTAVD